MGSYLLAPDEENYYMFYLPNKEFTFDVDVSNLPCGLNGALYFVEMDEAGGKYPTNTPCGDNASGERYDGLCDKDGCDFNSWRLGDQTFFGPGSNFAVNSEKPMTVVTQFITSDGTDNGDLVEIRRLYVQDGKVIVNSFVALPGMDVVDSITDEFCLQTKVAFGD